MTALRVARSTEEPHVEIRTVTPAVAKRWLARNVRNRPIRDKIVNAYARDMAAGSWQLTGEAIKFDTNGALSDGQHRLTAVVKSSASVQMLVVRGIEPSAQSVMDSGVKRSQADSLTLGGMSNAPLIVATARHALRYPELGYVAADEAVRVPTNSEVLAFVSDHPEVRRAADMGRHFYPAFDSQPSILGVCWMRLSEIDIEATAQFFTSVAEMRTDGAGDPRLALARRLQTMRRDKVRAEPAAHLSLILRAWNKWRRNETAATLPLTNSIPNRIW